jgi:hypothetical protein
VSGLALAGCGGSSNDASGRLIVNLTDSPVDDANEVVVVFTGLEIKPAEGPAMVYPFTEQQSIDLLDLQGGASVTLLDEQEVAPGQYEWIRVLVTEEGSYIGFDTDDDGETDDTAPLWIPSGAQTGLKLVRPFFVAAGGITDLTIDFDVRKSVIAPPGLAPSYLLKPTLRLVDNLLVGAIAGDVDVAYLDERLAVEPERACDPGVYLFNGFAATPDDQDENETNPVVYLPLAADETSGIASYLMPFVEAGEYTVAFTCDFNVDADPTVSEYNPDATEDTDPEFESMRWVTVDEVTVAAEETTEASFLPPETT